MPQLNAFREAFRFNGYRFPRGSPELLEEEPVPLGGKPQEALWPSEAVWPGAIPGSSPLAVRIELDFVAESGAAVANEFRTPHEIYLLSGGTLGTSVSYFLEHIFYEHGGSGELRRLFVQFDSPIWNNRLLNLKIGQTEIVAVPFSGVRRITMEDYAGLLGAADKAAYVVR